MLHGYNSRYLSFWIYPCVDQMVLKSGHIIQCCPEPTQWNIAWSLRLEYLDVGYQLRKLIWDPGDVLTQHLLSVTRPQAPILASQPADMRSSYLLGPRKKNAILCGILVATHSCQCTYNSSKYAPALFSRELSCDLLLED